MVAEMLPILTAYVASVSLQVENELDKPLTEDFQNKVIPALTDIVVRDIKTKRTSIETHGDVDGGMDMESAQEVEREIGFESFLNVMLSMSVEDMQSPENVRAVDTFINLFREEFESQVDEGGSLDENIYYYLDYIPKWKYIASYVGNAIFVKPLVECIMGVDLITGEKLSGFERFMQFVAAAGDVIGIGAAAKTGAGLRGIAEIVMVKTTTEMVSKMNAEFTQMFVKDMGGSDTAALISGEVVGILLNRAGGKLFNDALFRPEKKVEMETSDEIIDSTDILLVPEFE